MEPTTSPRRRAARTPRAKAGLWVACAAAATLLVLGTSGTLSSWTTAVLNNTSNTTATSKAVILKEANSAGTVTCYSSSSATNTANCSTIDKYGGTATPLSPGTSQVTTVTFSNVGSSNGTSFALAPQTCSQTPVAGTGTPPAGNVCTNGDLTIAISCSPGSTYSAGTAWSDLTYAAAAAPTATKSHTAASGDLNAGGSWTCQFTVALGSGASPTDQNIQISQQLNWTLNG